MLERRHVARRRGGHRRGLSRLPVLRLLLRRLAAAAGDHPRARPAAARPRDPAARRHVHADAERRLPVARQRSRARRAARSRATRGSTPKRTTSTARRWSRWAASSSRSSTMTPPDPTSLDPRGLMELLFLGRRFQALPRPGPVQPDPADDDERGRLSRSVVRDRRAQGDDVGVGHHRHVPRRALAGHGLRAAAPLHGRDRRRVPLVGLVARRHRRDLERHAPAPRARPAPRSAPSTAVSQDHRQGRQRASAWCSRTATT